MCPVRTAQGWMCRIHGPIDCRRWNHRTRAPYLMSLCHSAYDWRSKNPQNPSIEYKNFLTSMRALELIAGEPVGTAETLPKSGTKWQLLRRFPATLLPPILAQLQTVKRNMKLVYVHGSRGGRLFFLWHKWVARAAVPRRLEDDVLERPLMRLHIWNSQRNRYREIPRSARDVRGRQNRAHLPVMEFLGHREGPRRGQPADDNGQGRTKGPKEPRRERRAKEPPR
jgi:hypothetical protein